MKHILLLIFLMAGLTVPAQKVLKVLAIGNSFSVDAIEQNLYELAHAQGDSLVIGNAYIGGCSIDRHWGNTSNGKKDYSYRKIVGGVKTTKKGATLKEIIQDDEWDIITLQQASPYSGWPSSYGNLPLLMDYVKKTARKPFRFAFHETWAFSKNCVRIHYDEYYQHRPLVMYQAILKTVNDATKKDGIEDIIPCGVSIQRARAILGDTLNRDGYHLERSYGRYVAACTWCEYLTGKSVLGNSYYPENVTPQLATIAQKAAHEAMTWQKEDDITPQYYIQGEFYAECPDNLYYQLKQRHKGDGKSIITINASAALPDADRFYAIPEWKVEDAEVLKQLASTEDNAKIVKAPKQLNQIRNKLAFAASDQLTSGQPTVLFFWKKKSDAVKATLEEMMLWRKICPFAAIQDKSESSMAKALDVVEYPTMVLIDRKGRVRQSYAGCTQQQRDLMLKALYDICKTE